MGYLRDTIRRVEHRLASPAPRAPHLSGSDQPRQSSGWSRENAYFHRSRNGNHRVSEETTIIETFQMLIIAFVLAFTFRSYVVEAFVIPTGSMAPTLRGAHALVTCPDTGYRFPIGPASSDTSRSGEVRARLESHGPYILHDPMLNPIPLDGSAFIPDHTVRLTDDRPRMGDRILVLKYLYALCEPRRFDVVVFKYPVDPQQNFIKRLIGLPNENVWLADGDVFVQKNNIQDKPVRADNTASRSIESESGDEPFVIQRKPEHVQRHVWQKIFDSDYIVESTPSHGAGQISPPDWFYKTPFEGRGWTTQRVRTWRCDTASPTDLYYLNALRPVNDFVSYNEAFYSEVPRQSARWYPVSDIRLAGTLIPDQAGLTSTIELHARGYLFEAVLNPVNGGTATLRMRPERPLYDTPPGNPDVPAADDWQTLDTHSGLAHEDDLFEQGQPTRIEFWHVDQALWLFINDVRVCYGQYHWSARQRMINATGLDPDKVTGRGAVSNEYLYDAHPPKPMRLTWHFAGSPLLLTHVELDRDLYYEPNNYHNGYADDSSALATHPDHLARLNSVQYFVCGDNSPASLDGRLWKRPAPWVARDIDPATGIVNRSLLLGKAFFVYFPSPEAVRPDAIRFVPNFGEMRWIH